MKHNVSSHGLSAHVRSNNIGSAKWLPMRWRRKNVHNATSVCIDSLGNDRTVMSALEIFSACSELKRVIVASLELRAGSGDRNMGVVGVSYMYTHKTMGVWLAY